MDLVFQSNPRINSKTLIIVSSELVLHSQLKLPINLSEEEVSELVSLALLQRGQNSQINTYYDYYIKKLDDITLVNLFEARKDKLDSIISAFNNYGFSVSLIIPQELVILNQIIGSDDIEEKNYQIICHINRQIVIAKINDDELIELNQIHLSAVDAELSVVAELQVHLDQLQSQKVITLGLNLDQLKQYFFSSNFNFVAFQSLPTDNELTSITINWMREQYDLYQSVTLA